MARLLLNGFELQFSSPTVILFTEEMPDNSAFRALKAELGESWFLRWSEGKVWGLPKSTEPRESFGQPVEALCSEIDTLRFLAARFDSVLPERFPKYERLRHRPFTFLARKDAVAGVASRMQGLPPLIQRFRIRSKLEMEAKLVEIADGDLKTGVFLTVATRWEILASLTELHDAGVDLRGLHVIRRNPEPGEPRLIGRIGEIADGLVRFSESRNGEQEMRTEHLALEGSKSAFARCLKAILGEKYKAFEDERQKEEANVFGGSAADDRLEKLGEFFKKASPINLGGGLSCNVIGRLQVTNSGHYKSATVANPVEYCFDAAKTKRDQFPWSGLERFGPYSRDTFSKKSPRILVFFPDTVQGPVETFLRNFRDGVTLPEKSRYQGGFGKTFDLANPQFVLCKIPWLSGSRSDVSRTYREAVEEFLAGDSTTPDGAFVVILDEHSRAPDNMNPYLQTKALLLMAGVPVQEIRVPTLTRPARELQYICQDLAVSLYAKMNGTPWTVDHDLTITDEIVIGMGYCEISGSRFEERQRHIGITTVFRGDGNYLLANVSKACRYDDYPEVLRRSTLDILSDIKSRNGWRPGDTVRIVFHVCKPLKNVEVAEITSECVKALCGEQNVEFAFLTVSQDHSFTLFDKAQPGIPVNRYKPDGAKKAIYVPKRGTIVQAGRFTRLLCTNGPNLIKRDNAPHPNPLLVHLHPQSTFRDLDYLTVQVLKFTSLSWRSTLPARRPVTIYYSEMIAELLGRLKSIPDWSPAMLNVKLRASRWFL